MRLHGKSIKSILFQYLGRPVVLVKGLRPPSLFLAGGGSELEGLEDEDGRDALNWVVRALGRPDLKVKKLQTTKIYFLIGLKN